MKQAGLGYNDSLHAIFNGGFSLVLKYYCIIKDYKTQHPKYHLLLFMLTEYIFLSPVFIAMWKLLMQFGDIITKPRNLKEYPWDDKDFLNLAYGFTILVEPFYMAYLFRNLNECIGRCKPVDRWPLCFIEAEKHFGKRKRIKRLKNVLKVSYSHYLLIQENDDNEEKILTKKEYTQKVQEHFSLLFK